MPERYVEAILRYLSNRENPPLRPHQLARQMGVAERDFGTFREAVKLLRDGGQVLMGVKDALVLPEMATRIVGVFRANPRGFGFVIPDSPNAHGDLFVPPGASGGAMTGDHVVAAVRKHGKRERQTMYEGQVVEIIRRGRSRFVGTLDRAERAWFVIPDGKGMVSPISVKDIGTAGPKPGSKVVVEVIGYPEPGGLPTGVIVETLGEAGPLEIETLAVIRAHGLAEKFSDAALADARAAIKAFNPRDARGRENLTRETVITIDPPDARDFDDAISLTPNPDGSVTLGVHIADVSHFVREGSQLDAEARSRGTSVYFPRKVLPMLPEVLSNGVCSLQEGQRRYCMSAFITYDASAKVLSSRLAETVISSSKRLTYQQAQQICDGHAGGVSPQVVQLVQRMEKLARAIQARRTAAGALTLDLPAVELVFDESDRVADAIPEDQSYTHTVIEMLMVEANEAVARHLDAVNQPFLRRVHPAPDFSGMQKVSSFMRACGHKLPRDPSRHDLQLLLKAVKGRPESYAVNLAILKMFEQAEYSPMRIGHYALASKDYCHFTSPIRRYPDLTVHRLAAELCRGTLANRPPEDIPALVKLGELCSVNERHSEAAEQELRTVLLLQHLTTKVGEEFEGVITGVTNFGVFVQSPRYLIDGLIRIEHLGDDWWELDARYGHIKGERTGKTYRIGDTISVVIAAVDVARRQLDLVPQARPSAIPAGIEKAAKAPSAAKGGKQAHITRPIGKGKKHKPGRGGSRSAKRGH